MLHIDDNFIFHKFDKIVVGCSTGPDSMALVDMLLKIREKYQLSVIVAHVNHNVRKESYTEAEFLENYCREKYENNDEYLSTNAKGNNLIEKIIKTDNLEKSEGTEKYERVTTLEIDFIDFIVVQENKIAVLKEDSLSFYDVDKYLILIKK